MELQRNLLVTVGLPRSGKSTWARGTGYPIVNPDSIRLAVHGHRFYKPAEPLVWATAEIMVRSLFFAGHSVVILDATNTTKERRSRWLSSEWATIFVPISTNKDECIKRAMEVSDQEIIRVIESMDSGFEPLDCNDLIFDINGW